MVYKCWSDTLTTRDKSSSGGTDKSKIMSNQHLLDLAEKLHKPIIKKFKKHKVY